MFIHEYAYPVNISIVWSVKNVMYLSSYWSLSPHKFSINTFSHENVFIYKFCLYVSVFSTDKQSNDHHIIKSVISLLA